MQTLFVFLQKLMPQQLLSRLAGQLAHSENYLVKEIFIRLFCVFFPVNLLESERTQIQDYRSFNDFFTRTLREGCRPIAGHLCSPADGLVAALGNLHAGQLLQAKEIEYSLDQLLAETPQFTRGSFITIYLAPHNYHRVHAPCQSELITAQYIPGRLFSVNQTTTTKVPDLLVTNERLVCQLRPLPGLAAAGSTIYCVLVGAMLVASIKPAWSSVPCRPGLEVDTGRGMKFEQGEEIGYFQMGSTVVLVFDQEMDFIVDVGQPIKWGQPLV